MPTEHPKRAFLVSRINGAADDGLWRGSVLRVQDGPEGPVSFHLSCCQGRTTASTPEEAIAAQAEHDGKPCPARKCRLCAGPVVWLPTRGGQFSAGWTCLGCATLDAVPLGMVPEDRRGEDARSRRFVDAQLMADA
jgi:hypothetical protein